MNINFPRIAKTQSQFTVSRMKNLLLLLPICFALFTITPSFAQGASESSDQELDGDFSELSIDDDTLEGLINKIAEEEDGDDEVPLPVGKKKPPKVTPKIATTFAVKQAVRWKINKQSFVEGYVEEAIARQDDPYKQASSKLAWGLTGNYSLSGYTLSGGVDVKRGYTDVFGTTDGILDTTYSLGVAKKFDLSKQWSISPSVKQTFVRSDLRTKELTKSAFSLPLAYSISKAWNLKVLTVGFATQTYTGRDETQTDKTWTLSTGLAYKWTEKSSFEVSVSREDRFSTNGNAEYSKVTIMPKYDYKISPTSSLGIGVGYENHATYAEEYSRWLLVPKLQLRLDI